MAFTIKDNRTFSGTGIATSTHFDNVANGDDLFVFIAVNNSTTGRISNVTDSNENVYTKAEDYGGTDIEVECWYSMNATVNNGTVCTVTPTIAGDKWAAAWVSVTGVGNTNSFDRSVGNSGTGTSLTSGTTDATRVANEIIFSVNGQANNRAWTNGSGYTNIASAGNGTAAGVMVQYKTVTATGTQSATASLDISSKWVASVFTFAESTVSTTVSQTTTGVSKINALTTKTTTGVSRMTATTTKTTTGVSNMVVAGTTTKTTTGVSRLKATTTKTTTGVSNVVTTRVPIFTSACATLDDFNEGTPYQNLPNETVTIDATGGHDGGAAIKIVFNATASNEVGIRKALTQNIRYAKWRMKVGTGASAANNSEHTFMHVWDNSTGLYADLLQVRLKWVTTGSKFAFVLRNGTTLQYSQLGTKQFSLNTWYEVELYMTDYSLALLVDDVVVNEWFGDTSGLGMTGNVGAYMNSITFGKFYSTQLTATIWIDDVTIDVAPQLSLPATDLLKMEEFYASWKKRYLRSDGAVVRPHPQGNDGAGNSTSDIVSEGQGYALMLAVQFDDQATFDLVEGITYNTFLRKNSDDGQVLSYGSQMIQWHFNDITMVPTSMDNGKNWATDADVDRLKGLYWAHAKWGSAGAINYLARANALWADFKTYVFRTDGSLRIQTTDQYQSTTSNVELNLSYIDPVAYELALRYNPADSTVVTQAINGAYTVINGATDNTGGAGGLATTTGLPPDWAGYNPTSSNVGVSNSNAVPQALYGNTTMLPHTVGVPPNNRLVKYSYDAFRTIIRVYWHHKFFANADATTYLSGAFKSFMQTEWTAYSKIGAEYEHDGTTIGDRYEKTGFTWMAYFAFDAAGSALATDVFNGKLQSSVNYFQDPIGDYLADGPNATGVYRGAPSYFSDSWTLMSYALKTGQFIDIKGTTTTKTTTGISRIGLVTQKTTTGVSNILPNTATQTITGISNLTSATVTTRTQTLVGTTRLHNTTTKTATGVSRIGLLTAQTITSTTNVRNIPQLTNFMGFFFE